MNANWELHSLYVYVCIFWILISSLCISHIYCRKKRWKIPKKKIFKISTTSVCSGFFHISISFNVFDTDHSSIGEEFMFRIPFFSLSLERLIDEKQTLVWEGGGNDDDGCDSWETHKMWIELSLYVKNEKNFSNFTCALHSCRKPPPSISSIFLLFPTSNIYKSNDTVCLFVTTWRWKFLISNCVQISVTHLF